jgi:hypothetical protein
VKRIVRVSVESARIVKALPALNEVKKIGAGTPTPFRGLG